MAVSTYKKAMGYLYGIGASVVILGALFKLMHWPGASVMLIVGLGAEALIFFASAFEPVGEDLDWSLVYPELAGGQGVAKKGKKEEPKDAEGLLSKKLDNLLKDAKIDGELMASLGNSIKNFEGAAKGISPTVDSMAATKKYGEEMSIAAAQMESASKQASINAETVENASKLKEQMQSLASNLSSLNGVYGGMLTAMNKK